MITKTILSLQELSTLQRTYILGVIILVYQ